LILAVPSQGDAAWFTCLGQPLVSGRLEAARAYFSALGYAADAPIHTADSWVAAERIARDPQWDRTWWEFEEQERDRLLRQARDRLGAGLLLERLSAATELAADAIHAAAAIAAERDGVADAALIRAASGAAAMALHEAALARLAGCDSEHLFMRKYRVFESGRWPLGVLRGAFYLF
jgi:hypothetical protein